MERANQALKNAQKINFQKDNLQFNKFNNNF